MLVPNDYIIDWQNHNTRSRNCAAACRFIIIPLDSQLGDLDLHKQVVNLLNPPGTVIDL